ncbi:cytochrome P450 hydroxylase [Cystobacter fuscus]|uniref:Cytochrome P450 hydroxylase n=1 Tax=Cystobacter fuscus TaxID=43 RepID=A0A250JBK9_9BACT|nr:cytochrome P450 [Cystobacter fuscus]ATB40963.1 cytochrome P450 hydroxylase [Cystobacter fuscus]
MKPMDESQKQTVEGVPSPAGTCPFKHLMEAPAPSGGSVVLDRENPEFLTTAYATYARLREQAPVVRTLFARGVMDTRKVDSRAGSTADLASSEERLLVTRYDEAVAALLDGSLSSDFRTGMTPRQIEGLAHMPEEARPLADSLISRDPPDHTRLRKLVQPSFTARAMETLRPRVQRITDALLDKAEREAAGRGQAAPDRQMDLLEAFAYPMPITVISDLLGIPEEDRERINHLAELLMNTDRFDASLAATRRDQTRRFNAYLEELFERKRREPAEDMISQMVHTQEEDGDRLGHEEMISMVHVLFFAGHLTTVNLIGNGVVALFSHPDQHARMVADPSLAKGMVEETLRYWGPVDYIGTARTAIADTQVGGVSIPQETELSIGLGSANRDPSRFPDPDVYDITRPEAHRNIAFGKGIHVCLGAPLARLEGQIAFETLFRRYPKLRLAVPAEQLKWGAGVGSGVGLRGFARIPVLF